MTQRILITTSSFNIAENKSLTMLRQAGFEIMQNPFGRRLTEVEVRDLLKSGVTGMIAGVEPLTRSVLMGAEKLRVISRCGIGMDNVDMDADAEKNILVKNTLDAPGMAVAELTVGLMLNLLRHVSEADRLIRADRWKQLMGRLLQKQTVGLVGFGRIGKRVARLVSAFGATILAYDTYEMPPFPDLLYAHIFFLSELPRPVGGVIHSGNIKGRFLRVTGRWENNEELLVISASYDRRLKRRSK